MPTLPKFLRYRGISSSTKTLGSCSSQKTSRDNIVHHSSSDKIRKELPRRSASVNGATSSGTRSSDHSEGNDYRTMPVFRTNLSNQKHGSSGKQNASKPSTSNSSQSNKSSTTDQTLPELATLQNEIKRLRNLMEKQADETLHLHSKDALENERLKRLNRYLREQLRDKEVQMELLTRKNLVEEEETGTLESESDHSHNSNEEEDTFSVFETIRGSFLNRSFPSDCRVTLERFEVSSNSSIRGQKVTITGNNFLSP